MNTKEAQPKLFPDVTVKEKLKRPKLPEVHPILYTIYGILHKGLSLTNTELNRSLARYKLTQDALTILFGKASAKSPKTASIREQFLKYISHLNQLSATPESRTLQFLANDFFNPTEAPSPNELTPIPPEDAISSALQATDDSPDQLTPTDPPPVQLTPVLSPIALRIFGEEEPDPSQIEDILSLVTRTGLDTNAIIHILKHTNPLLQMGTAALITETFIKNDRSAELLAFIESNMRELSVRKYPEFLKIYSFLFRTARMPLSKAESPRGLFPFEQYRRLSTILKGCTLTDLGIYQTAYLRKLITANSPIINIKTKAPIETSEVFNFYLSIISNIEFSEPKLEVWGSLAERLHSLVASLPTSAPSGESRGQQASSS